MIEPMGLNTRPDVQGMSKDRSTSGKAHISAKPSKTM